MLFNFQGPQPNLVRLAAPSRNSLFIISCRPDFVKHFFQSFFDSFKCQTFRSSMMENCVFGFVKPFLRFPPLPSRGQLIYITTPDPVCQHLFSYFFDFFQSLNIFLSQIICILIIRQLIKQLSPPHKVEAVRILIAALYSHSFR